MKDNNLKKYRVAVRFGGSPDFAASFTYTCSFPVACQVSISRSYAGVPLVLRRIDVFRDLILLRFVNHMLKIDSSVYDFIFENTKIVWGHGVNKLLYTMTCHTDFMFRSSDRGERSCEGLLTVKVWEA